MDMIQVFIGALVLSLVHAIMPDHWIPLIMISRSEKWSRIETSWITALIAIPHIISTTLIGIIIGIIGYKLSSTHELVMRAVTPLILVAIGVIYASLDFRVKGQHHHRDSINTGAFLNKSKLAIVFPLATALFFSPCVAIGSYFFVAAVRGWFAIAMVSAIYLIVTILGMVLMVNLGLRGVEKIKWHFLECHERLITGIVLIILGVLIYFIEI